MQKGHLAPKQEAIFRQIEANLPAYNGWTNKMYATLKSINSLSGAQQTQAILLGVKDITVSNATVSNLMGNLYSKLHTQIGADENVIGARIPAAVNSGETLSIVVGVVALVLAALITFLIIRSITGPLAKVADAADRVAEVVLDVELDLHGRDEISKVARSIPRRDRPPEDNVRRRARVRQRPPQRQRRAEVGRRRAGPRVRGPARPDAGGARG